MHFSPRTTLFAAAAATLALALPSVSGAQRPPVKVQLPPGGSAPPREPPRTLTKEEQKGGPNRARLAEKGLFQLDFDKVEIEKLIQTMSDMTGKLFILPENIRGKITIIGPEHGKAGVTADEAYAAFLSALDANSLTLYQAGKYWKIVEKRAGKQSNIPVLLDGEPVTLNEQMVTRIFRLKYAEVEQVRGVVGQLVTRDGEATPYLPDMLIVHDTGLNIHRLSKIIEQLDRPSSSDEIRIVQVQHAMAGEIADKLRQVFEDKGKKPGQRAGAAAIAGQPAPAEASAPNLSLLLADERTNKIIVVANQNAFERIQELLKHLDQPVAGEGQVHVYYLENANAEELSSTLSSLASGVSSGSRSGRSGGGGPPGGAPGAKGGGTAELFSGEVKISADKSTNSLVVIASANDYRNLVSVIRKLDIARRQVFVEAVIMEVNLDNDLNYGISVHGGDTATLKNPGDSLAVVGSQTGISSLGGVGSLATMTGFLAGLQGPTISNTVIGISSFAVVMQALQKSSDVNVLSTPHILTSDNEEAEISVGQNVPFQAAYSPNISGLSSGLGSALGTAGSTAGLGSLLGGGLGGLNSLYAPIQRQNVELKLKIKPQINESDFIRLEIDEQTEEIASTDPQLGPTTAKRSAKTTVVARDQQTVVIGGLIQDRAVRSVTKTPILGDIPVLGWLFRSTTNKKTKTNLLLVLTPYIIRDQADFRRIFERKLKERQEFAEQFYGRQPGFKVPIDYNRKAGPLIKAINEQSIDSMRPEMGGDGLPGEKAFRPAEEEGAGRVAPQGAGSSPAGNAPQAPAPAPAPALVQPLQEQTPGVESAPPAQQPAPKAQPAPQGPVPPAADEEAEPIIELPVQPEGVDAERPTPSEKKVD